MGDSRVKFEELMENELIQNKKIKRCFWRLLGNKPKYGRRSNKRSTRALLK